MFRGPLRHRFIFGRGMVSDDTEHTRMTLQSLQEANGDVEIFRTRLARRLKIWLLCIPAGAGLATVKATLRLLIGVPPAKSGVSSAGNGPAMRAAIIGAWFADDPERRISFTEASSVMTHRDLRAREGAQLVALAASCAAKGDAVRFHEKAKQFMTHPAWQEPLDLEKGVSGYVIPTVRVALDMWQTSPDYRSAITRAVEMGGDTDTVAAIVGGIVGAGVGREGIPQDWSQGLLEPPTGVSWPLIPFRNALFLATVLVHGLRRALPPY
jgi:ADP-ribosylglycohydrolase